MIYIVMGLLGSVKGAVYLYGRGDFLLGGVIGLLVAAVINRRNRFLILEKRLADTEARVAGRLGDEKKSASPSPAGESETPLTASGSPCWKPDSPAPGKEPADALEMPTAPVSAQKSSADISSMPCSRPVFSGPPD